MRQSSPILIVAFTLAAAGCANSRLYCSSSPANPSDCKDLLVPAIVGAAVIGAATGVYYLATRRGEPATATNHAPAPAPARVEGRVRWDATGDGVPSVSVRLRRADNPVVLTASTDREGRFQFPYPATAGRYVVSVETGTVQGETTVWLQDRRPVTVEVRVRPPADPAVEECLRRPATLPGDRAASRGSEGLAPVLRRQESFQCRHRPLE